MAEEKVLVPKFNRDEDGLNLWLTCAEIYAERFEFAEVLAVDAEPNLPEAEGPGVNEDEEAAVERNRKAVLFLMLAMPNAIAINVLGAGKADKHWPNKPKAHLMVQYLKETFQDTSTLSKIRAKCDLEACVMKKEDNPKNLFEQLESVQFKYAGNAQARISEGDLVTQAVQALPSMYNSCVVNLFDAEQHAGRNIAMRDLKQVVKNYYAIFTKGKMTPKKTDIEGGLTAIDDEETTKEKDNLKQLIMETVSTTIQEFSVKHQPSKVNQGYGEANGHGLAVANYPMGQKNNGANNSAGITPEIMMVIMQATK
jgi:gag-polypeptide of LTR copia-type